MVNTKKIKARMKEIGAKQEDISEMLGVKQGTVSMKLNNARKFSAEEAIKVMWLLDVDCGDMTDFFIF